MSNGLDNQRNLGTFRLVLFSIGLTLASGVFSMMGDFAANGAYTGAVLIGWAIAGVGMLGLSMSFYRLSIVRPELTSGIYSYAREGFGDYIGFNSAWGYWISAILAQVSFVTLFFAALGYFFPAFGAGNNLTSIVVGSVIIWLLFGLILRGVNEAVTINAIVVIAKIVPILSLILTILVARAFDWSVFTQNFWGEGAGMSIFDQVKATTYVTVWIFIGIEGAVVISGRAKNTKIAGRATAISFLSLLALYFAISFLSMGVMPAEDLAELGNPRMAGILEYVVGPWGAVLVNVAVIISIGGALLSYTILATDSAFAPAVQKCFPKIFTKLNKRNAPVSSALISTLVIQMFLIIVYFNESSYQICYTLSTSAIMFPYFLSALFCLKITVKGEGMSDLSTGGKAKAWIFTIIGAVYGFWLLYSSGLTYILVSALLYAPGTILYLYSKKEQKEKFFGTKVDMVVFVIVMIAFIASIVALNAGTIAPF